jgi:hypothetical protein
MNSNAFLSISQFTKFNSTPYQPIHASIFFFSSFSLKRFRFMEFFFGNFQVSLTLDCTSGTNLAEGEDTSILHELEETTSPAEPQLVSPTKKSNTIRGIFSNWKSSSQEASVDKGEDMQRLMSDAPAGVKQRESSIFGLLPLAALRAAASRDNLDSIGGGSGPNSPGPSPSGSPSFLAKQVQKIKTMGSCW